MGPLRVTPRRVCLRRKDDRPWMRFVSAGEKPEGQTTRIY